MGGLVPLVLCRLRLIEGHGGRARVVADRIVGFIIVVVDNPRPPTQGAHVPGELRPSADDRPINPIPFGFPISAVRFPTRITVRAHAETQACLYVVAGCPKVLGSKGTAAPV